MNNAKIIAQIAICNGLYPEEELKAMLAKGQEIPLHVLHKDGYYKPEEIVLMPIPGSGSKEFLFCVKMYCEM